MADNRGVAYMGTGKVEVHDIDFPTFELQDGPGVNPDNVGRKLPHAAILRCVSTNICGSDQHMVRGRTTAPEGLILGHEITGEVIETGPGVEFIKVGDLCSVPFNIACGRCRMCKTGNTGVCLNVNPDRPGSAYGYVDMGGWVGGQAEYGMDPDADWNLHKLPHKDQAHEKSLDLTTLPHICPTGHHGAVTAGVGRGSPDDMAAARRRANRDHGRHPGRRQAGHSRAVCDRRSWRRRRGGEDRQPVDPPWPRMGEVALVHDRPVPGHEVPPRAHGGDPPRPRADREGGQRDGDNAR